MWIFFIPKNVDKWPFLSCFVDLWKTLLFLPALV